MFPLSIDLRNVCGCIHHYRFIPSNFFTALKIFCAPSILLQNIFFPLSVMPITSLKDSKPRNAESFLPFKIT